MQILGMKCGSSSRTTNTLEHQAISLARIQKQHKNEAVFLSLCSCVCLELTTPLVLDDLVTLLKNIDYTSKACPTDVCLSIPCQPHFVLNVVTLEYILEFRS